MLVPALLTSVLVYRGKVPFLKEAMLKDIVNFTNKERDSIIV
jgi:hypothetical protein